MVLQKDERAPGVLLAAPNRRPLPRAAERDCDWVGKDLDRCGSEKIKDEDGFVPAESCPETCETCPTCEDSTSWRAAGAPPREFPQDARPDQLPAGT